MSLTATERQNLGCIDLRFGQLELQVTSNVGPRILHLALDGGANLLHVDAEERRDPARFHSYGGHRFWLAPETERTYYPDNHPCSVQKAEGGVWLRAPIEQTTERLQRSLGIFPDGENGIRVAHEVRNHGGTPVELAPWGITVIKPGGTAFMPLPPRAPHDMDHLLPDSQLALWSYTDFSDPRWVFRSEHMELSQSSRPLGRFSMQKTGIFHPQGWVAYWNDGTLLVKTADFAEGEYPDRGCNLELFTNETFMELETLGPLRSLAPGSSAIHVERWRILTQVERNRVVSLCKHSFSAA